MEAVNGGGIRKVEVKFPFRYDLRHKILLPYDPN